jgi:methionyl-tRNA formyltransferase
MCEPALCPIRLGSTIVPMRIVFFGSGAFGLPTLQHLSQRHEIFGVVTQPDKPAGRGGKLTPTPIGEWAATNLKSVPIIKPVRVKEPTIVEQIRAIPADAWVVIAFGQKLPKSLLEGRFAINLHASLLPRWRGAAPINAAILGGDTETGNSVITLADRMDAGQILGTSKRAIDPLMTAGELHDLLALDGPLLVDRVLADFAANRLAPVTQDESLVTIATKLGKDDDHVDYTQRADFVRRQVHALTPWPGVSAAIVPPKAGTPAQPGPAGAPIQIKVRRVRPIAGTHQEEPGALLDIPGGVVACGQQTRLQLLEVQPPGRTVMSWADFVRGSGRGIVPGARIVPARELV